MVREYVQPDSVTLDFVNAGSAALSTVKAKCVLRPFVLGRLAANFLARHTASASSFSVLMTSAGAVLNLALRSR